MNFARDKTLLRNTSFKKTKQNKTAGWCMTNESSWNLSVFNVFVPTKCLNLFCNEFWSWTTTSFFMSGRAQWVQQYIGQMPKKMAHKEWAICLITLYGYKVVFNLCMQNWEKRGKKYNEKVHQVWQRIAKLTLAKDCQTDGKSHRSWYSSKNYPITILVKSSLMRPKVFPTLKNCFII